MGSLFPSPEVEFYVIGDFVMESARFMESFDGISDVIIDVLRNEIQLVGEKELRQLRQKRNLRNGKKVH